MCLLHSRFALTARFRRQRKQRGHEAVKVCLLSLHRQDSRRMHAAARRLGVTLSVASPSHQIVAPKAVIVSVVDMSRCLPSAEGIEVAPSANHASSTIPAPL
jgi:hypothetical protein